MLRLSVLAVLLVLAVTYNFPMYKQCDSKWANERLGTSSSTICQAGCLMSSSAMALTGIGKSYNPSTLNSWLIGNGGYVSDNLYVWAAVNRLGMTFQGFINNNAITSHLDNGYIVIMNVHNGGHWVLATGYSGDTIRVNDPGYATSAYTLAQVVNGNTGVYTVNKMPDFLNNWILSVEEFIYYVLGKEEKAVYPPIEINHEVGNIRQE
jgi:ABC-type bacteriocin/lantibiotic exporter with double-glycine peptidase domain